MDDNYYKKIREEKLKKIRELGWNPYAASYNKTHSIKEATEAEGKKVATAGRIYSYREHGNIAFADLHDETGKIQIFFQKKNLGDEFKNLKLLDIGDFIGVEGDVMKTTAGEISITPSSYTLLTKSLLPIPSEFFGVKDIETRFRQRYLDLLLNSEVRERFNVRTKLVSGIREYLDKLDFWEVETPDVRVGEVMSAFFSSAFSSSFEVSFPMNSPIFFFRSPNTTTPRQTIRKSRCTERPDR